MARKKKPASGPNNGYLVSFGDTMTALLAFFIVLNSLASEQTGANLHSGTGSFVEVSDSHGVAGIFRMGLSRYSLEMEASSPIYPVGGNDEETQSGVGSDEDADTIWIRDRVMNEYEQFLTQMERFHKTRPDSTVVGEVTFDRLTPLPHPAGTLDPSLKRQLAQLLPILAQGDYELKIVVWSTTPGESAWNRAVLQAADLRRAAIHYLNLPPDQQHLVSCTARPWFSSTIKRPSMSIQVRKIDGFHGGT
ncbi:MAG: flagellar motor protein MotB [Planctomycetaceae bacterium]